MFRKPRDHEIRGDLIKGWWSTRKITRVAYQRLADDQAARVQMYWYRLGHRFLRYVHWLRDGIHLTAYSAAIILASSGAVWPAAILGSIGILISKRLTGEQVKMQARKMAYDSIEDREEQKRRDRERDPLI